MYDRLEMRIELTMDDITTRVAAVKVPNLPSSKYRVGTSNDFYVQACGLDQENIILSNGVVYTGVKVLGAETAIDAASPGWALYVRFQYETRYNSLDEFERLNPKPIFSKEPVAESSLAIEKAKPIKVRKAEFGVEVSIGESTFVLATTDVQGLCNCLQAAIDFATARALASTKDSVITD